MAGAGGDGGGRNSGGSARMWRASGVSGAKPAHSSPGVTPSAARSASICAGPVTIV